jgi:septal ring factor EnvC (AmiA/AmiB activator)
MFIDAILISLIGACVVAVYLVKVNSEKPGVEVRELMKSVKSVQLHLTDLDDTNREQDKSLLNLIETSNSHIEAIKDLNTQSKELVKDMDEIQDHLSKLRDSDQYLDKRFLELAQRVDLIDLDLTKTNKILARPINVRLGPMKSESHTMIVKRKGRVPYKKTIQLTKPYEKKSKFNMPGVKESKVVMEEAGL